MQNNPEYLDYLSRAGEDNDLYYDVKIAASKLLQDNIDNTFVTPVFNGSASLRDAAGQMIENTTKSVRRKETVDAAYMDKLFADVTALYRLDQIQKTDAKQDLGPLPDQSVILLVTLAVIWAVKGLYVVKEAINKKKVQKNEDNS